MALDGRVPAAAVYEKDPAGAGPPNAGETPMKKKYISKYTARQQIRWVWQRAGKYKYGAFGVAVLRMWSALNGVLFSLVFKVLVDGAVGGQGRTFVLGFGLYAALFGVQDLIWSGLFHLNRRVSFQVSASLKSGLYEGLLRTEYSAIKNYAMGELNSRLNRDVDALTSGMLTIIPGSLSMLVRAGGAALVLYWWEPSFLVLYVVLLAGLALGMVLLRNPMKHLQQAVLRRSDDVQAVQQDTLNNTLMVQTFLAYQSATTAWKDRLEDLRRAVYRQNRFSNLLHTGYGVLADLGYLACLLWFGAGVLRGQISYGTLSAALQLVSQIQNPFGDVTQQISTWYSFQASADRLMDLDALPKESLGEDDPAPDMEAIVIKGLSFAYDQDDPTLENISLDIHRGDCIAFVGASGAGKSTMLKILLSLYAFQSGQVTVRDKEGNDIPLSPATRKLFAYVPQGHSMIAGTIQQVVSFRYDKTDFTPREAEQIEAACRVACADEFIRAMPAGYQTKIGEGGAGVSEGQLQRLAIARAIYYGAPVLLLDEATSALDEATERRVLENIRALRDRTVLTVTHNSQALSICNRIVRVKGGKLYEEKPAWV